MQSRLVSLGVAAGLLFLIAEAYGAASGCTRIDPRGPELTTTSEDAVSRSVLELANVGASRIGQLVERDGNPLWGKVTAAAVHAGHGVLMSFAFVILLPLGAMSQRLSFLGRYRLHFHVGCQLFAYALVLMGFILGLWVAVGAQDWFYDPHARLGFCLVGMISLQPLLGVWHHTKFRRSDVRSWRYHVHVWYGRVLVVMGIVNGGLGLRLAANYNRGELICYIVLAVATSALYVVVVVVDCLGKQSVAKE